MKHLVAECNQRAVCGTCGKDHQTVECAKTEREAFWCISCNVSGHASWDRLFLGFLAASKQMEEADPEHTYKCFPGQEAWTWEHSQGTRTIGRQYGMGGRPVGGSGKGWHLNEG